MLVRETNFLPYVSGKKNPSNCKDIARVVLGIIGDTKHMLSLHTNKREITKMTLNPVSVQRTLGL